MDLQQNQFLTWQIIPILINTWLGIYILNRRGKKPGAHPLAWFLFAGAFWSFVDAVQLASPNRDWQLFWQYGRFVAIITIPTTWFFFTIRISGFSERFIPLIKWLLLVIPGLTMLALLTNTTHQLFFNFPRMLTTNGLTVLVVKWGILYYTLAFYSYALILTGVVILVRVLIRDYKNYGFQTWGLIFGLIMPLSSNLIYQFGNLPPGIPDPTPISFTVTGILFAWSIFSGHFLDVVSIAHESVISRLSTGIIILDREDRILDINQEALKILNIQEKEAKNLHVQDLLKEGGGSPFGTVQNFPLSTNMEFIFRPEGKPSQYEVKISGIHDAHENSIGRLMQFFDISRQVKAEEDLASTQENLTFAIDSLKDYYFETNVEGFITNINKAFSEHLGYAEKDELLGKHFRHFTDRETARLVFQNFRKLYETKSNVDLIQYTYHTKDGQSHIGEATLSPIKDGDQVIGARGLLRDITDRVRGEEQLKKAKDDLQARADELAAINRIASISNQSLNLGTILYSLCSEFVTEFNFQSAVIGICDENGQNLSIAASHFSNDGGEETRSKTIPLEDHPVLKEVVLGKKSFFVTEPVLLAQLVEPGSRKNMNTTLLPLLSRDKVMGILELGSENKDRESDSKNLRLAEIIASQVTTSIVNAQLFSRTESALGIIERDLEIGRQIQSDFFPEFLPELPGWELAAYFDGARQVSGDFYDIFQVENSRFIALVIADVCDKGVGAAFFMVLVRSLLRAFSFLINSGDLSQSIRSVISNTNNYIAKVHGNANMFATLFFGILDPEDGSLYYINAGHEPPALVGPDGKLSNRLMPTGPALGLVPDVNYQVGNVLVNHGDFLVAFTDGISDANNASDISYSEKRLIDHIQSPWTSLFSMVFEIQIDLAKFTQGRMQFDDITLIALRRKPTGMKERHAICRSIDQGDYEDLLKFIDSASTHCGSNPEDTIGIKTVANEIISKIFQGAYPGKKAGLISLSIGRDADILTLTLRDDGSYEAVEIEDKKIGFVDQINHIKIAGGGNQIVIEKKIKPGLTREQAGPWKFVQAA